MRPCKKTIGLHNQYDRTEISIMKLCCRLKMGLVSLLALLVHRSFGGVMVPPLERIGWALEGAARLNATPS